MPPRPQPARQPSLREHNLALVMREVADAGPVSRARIAAETGLTKATVSTLVDTLLTGGLVRELGPHAVTGVGRPGSALALAPGPVGIGLEINVDYVATCTVDAAGTVRRRELVAEDFGRGPAEVAVARAGLALRAAVEDARAGGDPLAGVVVAVPGLVEAARGVVRLAPNLGWRDVPLVAQLTERAGLVGVPVRLDNEANLAGLGELWCAGHHRPDGTPLDSFVLVSGEIGVGAAIVLDGELFGGMRGFSGELGHLPLDPDGPPCRCGARGCLEQYAGQGAVLRRAGLSEPAGTTTGRPGGPVDRLVAAATAGDPQVLAAVREAGEALGSGIATMINLMDIQTVVLSGLYARLAPWLLDAVTAQLARRVLASSWAPVEVLVSSLGSDGAVRGAALSAVRHVIDDPAAWLASAR
jgi:predicted NBD/HSP70 family sugar kinase